MSISTELKSCNGELNTKMPYFLRELARSDLAAVNAWRNDREVQNWVVSPNRYVTKEIDDKWFDAYLTARAHCIRLVVCDGASGTALGAVYLLKIDWVARTAEFGILIGSKDFQGKGVGEFATRGILNHAFLDMNLHRIYLTVLADNERALNLYKKVGFVEEGCSRDAVFKNGRFVDLIQMGVAVSGYRKQDVRGDIPMRETTKITIAPRREHVV